MASLVFLRAANVGKHNRFQPSLLTRDLARFGVINIGAVGTFVVPGKVAEKTLRAAFRRRLTIPCEVMICPADEIFEVARNKPGEGGRGTSDRRIFLTVMAEAPSHRPKLPIYAPARKDWEVNIVSVRGILVLSLWRPMRQNSLYPNQVVEKLFGVKTTTRTWNTIEKALKILASTGTSAL